AAVTAKRKGKPLRVPVTIISCRHLRRRRKCALPADVPRAVRPFRFHYRPLAPSTCGLPAPLSVNVAIAARGTRGGTPAGAVNVMLIVQTPPTGSPAPPIGQLLVWVKF